MKTKINNFIIAVIGIVFALIIFGSNFSCNRSTKLEIPTQKPITSLRKASCVCAPTVNSLCQNCVTSNFMMGELEQKYRIYWTSCTNDEPGFNCWPASNSYSNIKFCYSAPQSGETDCYLNMEVQTPPGCLPCITESPYCVRLKATCISNGNDIDMTLDDNDPNTPQVTKFHFVIKVKGDPVMTVCCSKADQFGQIHTYCCSGDLNPYPW